MQISLDEAIDIYGKALTGRRRKGAVRSAYERAAQCRIAGDAEGERIWLRVADSARRWLEEEDLEPAPRH